MDAVYPLPVLVRLEGRFVGRLDDVARFDGFVTLLAVGLS